MTAGAVVAAGGGGGRSAVVCLGSRVNVLREEAALKAAEVAISSAKHVDCGGECPRGEFGLLYYYPPAVPQCTGN